ncbi:hypothetical protein KQI84_12185 [bacterium]|nr:hypothetical protein [bacterium]
MTGQKQGDIPPWRNDPRIPMPGDEEDYVRPRVEQPRQGVYQQSRPVVVLDDSQLGVPRFFSAAFFTFFFGFLASPSSNAMFRREWLRTRRKLFLFSLLPWYLLLLIPILLATIATPIFLQIQSMLAESGQEPLFAGIYYALFALIHLGCNLLGFFTAAGTIRYSESRSMLDELAVTPLRPEEIAWGMLVGATLPIAYIAAALCPALLAIGIGASILGSSEVLSPYLILPLCFLFPVHMAATIFATGSIAISFAFTSDSFAEAATHGLGVCLVLGFLIGISGAFLGSALLPWTFLLIFPPLILIKFAIGCSFLQFLTRRVAERRLME